MTRVQIDQGLELHVEQFGPPDAPVVLLIHGTGADNVVMHRRRDDE